MDNCASRRTAAPPRLTAITSLGTRARFCDGPVLLYIAVAMDPGNENIIYLAGSADGTNGSVLLKTTNGTSFSRIDLGLHADSHALSILPSNAATASTPVNDGAIGNPQTLAAYGRVSTTRPSAQLNFRASRCILQTQISLIGGTTDNGTNLFQPAATWNRIDFGDGGFSAIDQNAADTTTVTMYHTYSNQTGSLIGFARVNTTPCAVDAQWSFKGRYGGSVSPTVHCDGATDTFNGIGLTDPVLFYPPLALGPGTPNTVYFGSDRLYRSTNKGDTMTVVSQAPFVSGEKVSAIGVSRLDDNYRIVGLTDGQIFGTATGANPLANVTGAGMPAKYVARAIFDPTNKNIAYVSFDGYGITAGQHVWKTTNFNGSPPTWLPAGTGIPDVPVNALAVDPANSSNVYAGTDIGVYASTDGGTSWTAFGTGLPAVAVFDMAIQNPHHILRIATHGRGMWQMSLSGGAAPPVFVSAVSRRCMAARARSIYRCRWSCRQPSITTRRPSRGRDRRRPSCSPTTRPSPAQRRRSPKAPRRPGRRRSAATT